MKIAVASPPFPNSIAEGLYWIEKLVQQAAEQQAEIICFPESYLPGYPGMGYPKTDREAERLEKALADACNIALQYAVAIIMPMDWHHNNQLLNVSFVISAKGEVLGFQSKNQLDPSEDELWSAGTERKLFEINNLKFGITICHEGFRYPESVRWAAQQGAQVIFHPHFTGSNQNGNSLTEWGHKDNPYYEKAVMMRALENTIFMASSNYASTYSDSASAIIAPDGKCIAHQPYGQVGIIVTDIDLNEATGLLAKRFKNSLYTTQL